ncbi:MAG: cobyric acid synthase [Desulfovibrio sp.]|jgi:adenosylcobyric acid synthase|nr:cobyric acid synthase [Desulfovibrio sp.]
MTAKRLMIQGTASSAGKSLLVTALCRIFRRRGLRVAPFKAQNMSLNSFITEDGREMGRAQAVQAEAAGIAPSALMNPILLKPEADQRSQIIVNGRPRATLTAREYYRFRPALRPDVAAALEQLAAAHDLILLEGAGSPAEINLRENDLANMGAAALADAPVLLVGDIDRGGVFASLYGTVSLLEAEDRSRIRGLIINKFRGDRTILEPGLRRLEDLLGIPFLGVLPWIDVSLDEEDSLSERLSRDKGAEGKTVPEGCLDIAVPRLPRLANFTDFAPLDAQRDVVLRYVREAAALGHPDLIILPGSKSTMADLRFLEESGLARAIAALHGQGTPVLGICAGFQMMGISIHDPAGVESSLPEMPGLGFLEMRTVFVPRKSTRRVRLRIRTARGLLEGAGGMEIEGYEIHMGHSAPAGSVLPLAERLGGGEERDGPAGGEGRPEGMIRCDGLAAGTYLHGIFDNLPFTRTLLNTLRRRKGLAPLPVPPGSYADLREAAYASLADAVEEHLDMAALERIVNGWDKPV